MFFDAPPTAFGGCSKAFQPSHACAAFYAAAHLRNPIPDVRHSSPGSDIHKWIFEISKSRIPSPTTPNFQRPNQISRFFLNPNSEIRIRNSNQIINFRNPARVCTLYSPTCDLRHLTKNPLASLCALEQSNDWAYSGVNRSFRLCPTYGRYLVVPSALDEEDIRKVTFS